MEKKLAKITKATLEIQERGILNFWIHVDYEDGFSQGIGGIALDTFDNENKQRIGTSFGCEIIRRLLLELQVNDFSEMKNKIIWVLGKENGINFKPLGIQALNLAKRNSNGVIFNEILEKFKGK